MLERDDGGAKPYKSLAAAQLCHTFCTQWHNLVSLTILCNVSLEFRGMRIADEPGATNHCAHVGLDSVRKSEGTAPLSDFDMCLSEAQDVASPLKVGRKVFFWKRICVSRTSSVCMSDHTQIHVMLLVMQVCCYRTALDQPTPQLLWLSRETFVFGPWKSNVCQICLYELLVVVRGVGRVNDLVRVYIPVHICISS